MPVTTDKFNALLETLDVEISTEDDTDLEEGSPPYPAGMDKASYGKAEAVANQIMRMEGRFTVMAKLGQKAASFAKKLENLDWNYSENSPQMEKLVDAAEAALNQAQSDSIRGAQKAEKLVTSFLQKFGSTKKR